MNLTEKVGYTANHIDSIARHDSETLESVTAALDRVIKYAQDAKATAKARERMPAKIAIGTDEKAIREKIANVQGLMKKTKDKGDLAQLQDLERTLGGMLPPVSGTFTQGAAPTKVKGKG